MREGRKLLEALRPGEHVVALDEGGRHMSSEEFAAFLGRALEAHPAGLAMVIGGPFGLSEAVRQRASERVALSRMTLTHETARLIATRRPIVALGTTALRALEASGGQPGPGSTDLFIYPGSGHEFRVVDHLITNFHLPESTLLMLVCAFAGTERVVVGYRRAVEHRYRFFSYGDAMLVL